MKFLKWEKLPKYMQNSKVKEYYNNLKKKRISLFFKRLMDIIMSLILLILFSPILLVFAIWIKLDSKGPVFYRQKRVTRYGKEFKIFKFRTMVQNADKIGSSVTSKNDPRITKVGLVIRKIRLDEIPQLINVLKGDMSFVGTRPEVQKFVDKYTEEMYATLLLPAGITSNAAINYRHEDEEIAKYISKYKDVDEVYAKKILPEKMKYNLEDLKKFNFFREIGICFKTIIKVIR